MATSPLENNRVVRMSSGNGYDLADAFNGARFEGDVANAGPFQPFDNLHGLLCCWDTSSDAKTFNRDALMHHVLPEQELEHKLVGIDVEGVEGETDTRRNLGEDFSDFSMQSCCVVVPSTSELNVVASTEVALMKPALTVVRVIPATMRGSLLRKGVSICRCPLLGNISMRN